MRARALTVPALALLAAPSVHTDHGNTDWPVSCATTETFYPIACESGGHESNVYDPACVAQYTTCDPQLAQLQGGVLGQGRSNAGCSADGTHEGYPCYNDFCDHDEHSCTNGWTAVFMGEVPSTTDLCSGGRGGQTPYNTYPCRKRYTCCEPLPSPSQPPSPPSPPLPPPSPPSPPPICRHQALPAAPRLSPAPNLARSRD